MLRFIIIAFYVTHYQWKKINFPLMVFSVFSVMQKSMHVTRLLFFLKSGTD